MHPIQGEILRVLLFNPQARFSELNASRVPSDQFTFHVKRLVELGLISKAREHYTLTDIGKELANRMDTDQKQMAVERQAKLGVLVVPVREKDSRCEYLVQQRLKQPFYGFHGFLTGKIRVGEKVLETAKRELEEESGLTGQLTLTGIKHKMDYSQEGKLLEDKFFYVFRAEKVAGKLIYKFEGGRNRWLIGEEIQKLPDKFDGVEETMRMINSKELEFVETKYTVKGF